MSTELTLTSKDNFDHAVKIAQTLAKSKMVPVSIQGKPEDIFAILVMGSELGVQPMQALQSINVIQGKPTISPQLMMAMVRGKLPDPVIDIKANDEEKSITCKAARSKKDFEEGLYYEAIWDMDRAERMGLSIKDNYKKQAKTMLTWRAVAEAMRMTFPDIIMGFYAEEEFMDFDGKALPTEVSKAEVVNMIDQDFPIPAEEKEVGDNYRIQYGASYRGKQLKDIPLDELAEYRETLIKRGLKKPWERDLANVLGEYLGAIEGIK